MKKTKIILLVFFLTLLLTGCKKENSSYTNMENNLKEQAEKYLSQYPGLFPKSGDAYFKAKDLSDKGYDASLDKTCDGYVKVTNNSGMFKYTSYINCKDYTTKNFDENVLKK